jgi:hypothetical protein
MKKILIKIRVKKNKIRIMKKKTKKIQKNIIVIMLIMVEKVMMKIIKN